jgi:hypothetical protein
VLGEPAYSAQKYGALRLGGTYEAQRGRVPLGLYEKVQRRLLLAKRGKQAIFKVCGGQEECLIRYVMLTRR